MKKMKSMLNSSSPIKGLSSEEHSGKLAKKPKVKKMKPRSIFMR
jgi:hypothetical protein